MCLIVKSLDKKSGEQQGYRSVLVHKLIRSYGCKNRNTPGIRWSWSKFPRIACLTNKLPATVPNWPKKGVTTEVVDLPPHQWGTGHGGDSQRTWHGGPAQRLVAEDIHWASFQARHTLESIRTGEINSRWTISSLFPASTRPDASCAAGMQKTFSWLVQQRCSKAFTIS